LIPFVIFSNLQTFPISKFISEKKVEFLSKFSKFCNIKIIRNEKSMLKILRKRKEKKKKLLAVSSETQKVQ
jgi:hypothetical protein